MTQHTTRNHYTKAAPQHRQQRGATLIVGIVVLMLITMTVISAFRVSQSHTQAVSNTQFKDEALAAANLVLEDVISLPDVQTLADANGAVPSRYIDINRDGVNDLQIDLFQPRCIRAEAGGSSGEEGLSGTESNIENTGKTYVLWEIQADVTDAATGASVSVVQGFRQQVGMLPTSCN
jgi:Na+-transporting NADH:ubiquinone oxidoreductase subunit NqrC